MHVTNFTLQGKRFYISIVPSFTFEAIIRDYFAYHNEQGIAGIGVHFER